MDIKELVPRETFKYCSSKGIDPSILIDSRIIKIYITLKKNFPSIYINNWSKGGQYDQSGYRNDKNVGSPLSQHRFGRAIDIHGVDNKKLYDFIMSHKSSLFPEITAIEKLSDTIGWLHLDVRTSDKFKIVGG